MKINKARRIISKIGYTRKRILTLKQKMNKNIRGFYNACIHLSKKDLRQVCQEFDKEQKRLANKIKWYSTITFYNTAFVIDISEEDKH